MKTTFTRLKLKQMTLQFPFIHFAVLVGLLSMTLTASAGTALNLAQTPLSVPIPGRPEVLLTIANSESMDGNLSGAIMTGSGSLGFAIASSPATYTVPTGFTAPVDGTTAGNSAAYTVSNTDNSASRLNVVKASILQVISTYINNTDFGLETYNTNGSSLKTTWVYYMSPSGSDFSFTNTAGVNTVFNPCYQFLSSTTTVNTDCATLTSDYGSGPYLSSTLSGNQFMTIGATSDNPAINDVLYAASSYPSVILTYKGASPANPFTAYTLSQYNTNIGSITESYHTTTLGYPFGTTPTNAGYIPYSPSVMYAERGFGFLSSLTIGANGSAGTIQIQLPPTSAPPTASDITKAQGKYAKMLSPEQGTNSSSEIKSLAEQSAIAGLLTTANTYLTGVTPGACTQKQYVILFTDGLPTQDLAGNNWPPLGSASAVGFGETVAYNADGSLNPSSTNDQALIDAVTTLATLKSNGILTYIVGVGDGADAPSSPAGKALTAMAIAGGTGSYFPATSPADVTNDLNIIMSGIVGTFTPSATAVSSSHLSTSTTAYTASYTVQSTSSASNPNPYDDWTGNVIAQPLSSTTGAASGSPTWQADGGTTVLLDTLDNNTGNARILATWNPALNSGSGGGAPFEWNAPGISTVQQADLQLSSTDTLGPSRLSYLRGNTSLEVRNGGTFRNRTHILGDIINSQPLFVGQPDAPYASTTYHTFQTTARTPMIYVGANDGMLHAFSASTGNELFAFIPNAVFTNLIQLTYPSYNLSHHYFVDGSPTEGDVQFSDSTWHTLLVGGENAGGQSIYALDISTPQTLTDETKLASAVKWEFTDADLGYTFSQPIITQTAIAPSGSATQSFAVFFGNGYNSSSNSAVLYAVDPATGSLIHKMDLCALTSGACSASASEGLSSLTPMNNNGFVGAPVSTLYAGDLQGNLWSVDVSNADATKWSARLLFTAMDSANPSKSQPITTAPVLTLNPQYPSLPGNLVMFGTGQLLQVSDMSNMQTQSVYGILDNRNFTTATYPTSRSSLVQQTLTITGSTLTASTNNVTLSSSTLGWYADLPTPGQRIVNNPILFDELFIAALNTPPSTTCGGNWSSSYVDLNYMTGGATANGISTNATAGVVGGTLGNGYASAPTGGFLSNGTLVVLFNVSNGSGGTGGGGTGGGSARIYPPKNQTMWATWWQIK